MGYVFIFFVVFCCFCCLEGRKNNTKQHNATLNFQRITLNFSRLQQKQRKQQHFFILLHKKRPSAPFSL